MKRFSLFPNLRWIHLIFSWFFFFFLLCFASGKPKNSSLLYHHFIAPYVCLYSNRKTTCTRKPCRLSSTPSPAPRRTISRSGRPPRLLTATSARVCCGASLGRGCAARSVGSKCTRSVKSFWTPTACRVSEALQYLNVGSDYQPQAKDGQGGNFSPSPPNGERYRWLSNVCFLNFNSQLYSKNG